MQKFLKGFSLIELVVFIIVMGLAAAAIVVPLKTALGINSAIPSYQTIALELAQQRMELILGQRRLNGYPPTDPCTFGSPPSVCTAPTGYTVSATLTTVTISGDTNYMRIDVPVTGLGNASLQMIVGNPQ
jgi:hypothetical protein